MKHSPTKLTTCQSFTLVEVIFSFAIAGIGVLTLTGMLYAVLNAGNDAVEETGIAHASSQFSIFINGRIRSDWDGFIDSVNGTFSVPVSSGGAYSKDMMNDNLADPGWKIESDSKFHSHIARPGLYKFSGDQLEVSIRVWQEQIKTSTLNSDGEQSTFFIDDGQSVRIFWEISWPFSKNYFKRGRWYSEQVILNSSDLAK